MKIYRGREVTGFAQDDTGVNIELSDGRLLRAKYLAGCDGGRSLVRKKAGIDFLGWDVSVSYLIAEVEMADEPAWGVRRSEKGVNALGKLDDGKRVGVVLVEPHLGKSDEPTLQDLRHALIAVYGTDFGVRNPTWLSRFTDMARQAGVLPGATCAFGWRRRARPFPGRRAGSQHRCPGCCELGMEARPGGQSDIAREPSRYLPYGAAPHRCAGAPPHHGANRTWPR